MREKNLQSIKDKLSLIEKEKPIYSKNLESIKEESLQKIIEYYRSANNSYITHIPEIQDIRTNYIEKLDLISEKFDDKEPIYTIIKSDYNQNLQKKIIWNLILILYLVFSIFLIILINLKLAFFLGIFFLIIYLVIYVKIIHPINQYLSNGLRANFQKYTNEIDNLISNKSKLGNEINKCNEITSSIEKKISQYLTLIPLIEQELEERIKKKQQFELMINKLQNVIESIRSYIYSSISTIGMNIDLLTEEINESYNLDVSPPIVKKILFQMDWKGKLIQKGNIITLRKDLSKIQKNHDLTLESLTFDLDQEFEKWDLNKKVKMPYFTKYELDGMKIENYILFSGNKKYTLLFSDKKNGDIVIETNILGSIDEDIFCPFSDTRAAFAPEKDENNNWKFFLVNSNMKKISINYNIGYEKLEIFDEKELIYKYYLQNDNFPILNDKYNIPPIKFRTF